MIMEQNSEKTTIRFLSFSDDKEDAEKEAKLKEAASRIEQAIARDKSLSELIDYQPASSSEDVIELANDTRPLFERLQEQANKKKATFEESQKLSNLVATLDEEDVTYLNEVAKSKHEDELKKRLEIYDALEVKKRLGEKRAEEEERRKKESLMGSKFSSKSSSLRSKIPLFKIKPKVKELDNLPLNSKSTVLEESKAPKQIESCIQSDCSSKKQTISSYEKPELDDREDVKRHKADDIGNNSDSSSNLDVRLSKETNKI